MNKSRNSISIIAVKIVYPVEMLDSLTSNSNLYVVIAINCNEWNVVKYSFHTMYFRFLVTMTSIIWLKNITIYKELRQNKKRYDKYGTCGDMQQRYFATYVFKTAIDVSEPPGVILTEKQKKKH